MSDIPQAEIRYDRHFEFKMADVTRISLATLLSFFYPKYNSLNSFKSLYFVVIMY